MQLQSVIRNALVDALREARAVVVLTGAGVSAESGIPTFRDAMEGLWAKFDPSQLATPEAFERDPETVTRWYDWRRGKCAAAKPNPAHLTLARLGKHFAGSGGTSCSTQAGTLRPSSAQAPVPPSIHKTGSAQVPVPLGVYETSSTQKRSFTLLTQNVDRLHQAAGSGNVVELHGTLWVWRCTRCGIEREEHEVPFKEYPPRCTCGGARRPAVVWFGEMLPEQALKQAHDALATCDFFFSIGTSAMVEPAASFIHIARHRGAKTAEINRDATPVSRVVDWSLLGKAGEVLPELVKRAFGI